jgi:hypothetical protein
MASITRDSSPPGDLDLVHAVRAGARRLAVEHHLRA